MVHSPSLAYDGKYKCPNRKPILVPYEMLPMREAFNRPFMLLLTGRWQWGTPKRTAPDFLGQVFAVFLAHFWPRKSLSRVWLFARSHGILQARILEWGALPFSRGSSQPGDGTQASRIAGDSLAAEPEAGHREAPVCVSCGLCFSLPAQLAVLTGQT